MSFSKEEVNGKASVSIRVGNIEVRVCLSIREGNREVSFSSDGGNKEVNVSSLSIVEGN